MPTIFKDYCKTSTLHIVRHIGDSEKTILERCLWSLVLVVFSAMLVRDLLEDWDIMRNGPLRVIVEEPPVNVGNLDFPSITICPNNAIDPDKMKILIKRVLGPNIDAETTKRFIGTLTALTLVINPQFDKGYLHLTKKKIKPFPIKSDDIIPFLKAVIPSLQDVFDKCFWRGTQFNCSDLLRDQITEQGFCYSFNNFFSVRYKHDSEKLPPYLDGKSNFFGLRTDSHGRSNGLELLLNPKANMSRNEIMFTAVLNSPRIIPPTNSMRPIRPRPTMVYRVQVEIEVNNVDKSLQEMNPASLPCNLHSNEPMENCLFRCRHHHIFQHCNCVLYTHAVLYCNESVAICGVSHLKCIFDIAGSLNYIRLDLPPGVPTFNDSMGMECNCKPTCSDVTYLATFQTTPRETDVAAMNYSAYIDVYYFSNFAMGYLKRTKLTEVDVIVGLGGTGGLYLGASFISFVEIIVVTMKIIMWYLNPNRCKPKRKVKNAN
ncbi:pickpocket protein 19-like [Macrosteles quadrilineatus]|uniref:pickpocket protein 19-like n=1 Tax=Macrosteles quadrilineatus TaxID=74068 RepID=UPI0023E09016|nr:pickpocket protein 19-like [Macrosteles quadrilineatus]